MTTCRQVGRYRSSVVPRYALDATLWDEPITGIGLYTHQLHRALSLLTPVERWGATITGELLRSRVGRSRWALLELPSLLQREKPDVFHALANFNLPLQKQPGTRLILTVHDLVPMLLPETVSRPFRWQFETWLSRSLTVADHVICVSETTRQSILHRFDISAERLTTIHHGVDHVLNVAPPDSTTVKWLDALGLPASFVLYAGALDARKNVHLVLKAVEKLFDAGTPTTLVLAGQRWFGSGPVEREIRRLRDRGVDVRPLGYLNDTVFYALMKRAGVFVFPSTYEGFGLPPLEAMALGVPTIISDAGSLPEVCGSGALQVRTDDAATLAEQIVRLQRDEGLRMQLKTAARKVVEGKTWARTAQQTLDVYRGLTR